jgi:ribosome recycling factor
MKKIQAVLDAENKMKKTVTVLNSHLIGITGYVNPAFIGSAKIGNRLVCEVADVYQEGPTATVVKIQPKNPAVSMKEIEKAVTALGIGNCGSVDGKTLQIARPAIMNSAVKDVITNVVRRYGEDAKVAIRNVRQEAKKLLRKADLSQDEERRAEKDLQKLTDDNIAAVDAMVAKKIKAI